MLHSLPSDAIEPLDFNQFKYIINLIHFTCIQRRAGQIKVWMQKHRPAGLLTRQQRARAQLLVHIAGNAHRDVVEQELRNKYGDSPDISKALRQLAEERLVRREGVGVKRSAFKYAVLPEGVALVEEMKITLRIDAQAQEELEKIMPAELAQFMGANKPDKNAKPVSAQAGAPQEAVGSEGPAAEEGVALLAALTGAPTLAAGRAEPSEHRMRIAEAWVEVKLSEVIEPKQAMAASSLDPSSLGGVRVAARCERDSQRPKRPLHLPSHLANEFTDGATLEGQDRSDLSHERPAKQHCAAPKVEEQMTAMPTSDC